MIGGFLGQRVAEDVFQFGQPGRFPDEIGVSQSRQFPIELLWPSVLAIGDSFEDPIGEGASDDGGQLQDSAHLLFQAIHARRE